MTDAELGRFRAKFTSGAPDECWEWQGFKSSHFGHGRISVNGLPRQAHRISYELHVGRPVGAGLFVCHACDNACCVNPHHLFEATPRENYDDMVAKGRRGKKPPKKRKSRAIPWPKAVWERNGPNESRWLLPWDIKAVWSRIDGENPEECWLWTGEKMKKGYGRFRVSDGHGKQRYAQAHRLVWWITYGPIPQGLCVCHACDTPSCCNFNHLFLATNEENMQDKARKGREAQLAGLLNGRCVLSEADVLEIRRKRASGVFLKTLAKEYGVNFTHIHRIVTGVSWKHLPMGDALDGRRST